MPSILAGHALTNASRIGSRLTFTPSAAQTTLLENLINAATDFIESRTNRRFKSTDYANELYSFLEGVRQIVALKQSPVTELSSVQYRAGTPSNPSWTDFITDQFELVSDGASGLVRIYGNLFGINNLRVSYTAGYLIDFAHVEDPTKHTLPGDLTDLCERMVVRSYKRREGEAEKTVGGPQSSMTWNDYLDETDQDVLARYERYLLA